MSFRSYSAYHDSNIDWVGRTPTHWTRRPLFSLVKEKYLANTGMIEDNLLSLSYGKIVKKNINDNDGLLPTSFEIYQIVEPNDIVWRLTDLQNDKRSLRTAIVPERGIITSAYLATQPLNIDPDFLNYLLRAYDQTKVFYSMGGGLRQSMKFADVKWLPVMLPPPAEQAGIVAFLDRETAKIDALVEEQQHLITLLNEKRQAVISHAVSKGLNPDAPTKNSDIGWLGEVPAHWGVAKAGRYLRILSGFAFPSEGFSTDPAHVRLLRGINVGVGRTRWDEAVYWPRREDDGFDAFELTDGELVIGMDRPWIAEGVRIAKLSAADLPCLLLQRVAALRPTEQLNVDYLRLILSSGFFVDYFTPDMTGVSVPHLSPGQINQFPIPLPPLQEQKSIVAYVNSHIERIDQLSTAAEEAMTLLKERRSALISAAVTGKIDVRGVVDIPSFRVVRAQARGLIAVDIIEQSAHQSSFGRVKLQKIAYLSEVHTGITELAGTYSRDAAGPLDRGMIGDMERGATLLAGIQVDQPRGKGTTVTYRLTAKRGAHQQELISFLGADRAAKFGKLIQDMSTLDTRGAEAVATLYAVWNDALMDGDKLTDDQIIAAFLSEWHPEKAKKFRADELHEWLGWMRRHDLVPTGSGPKTSTGRLFA